jgi:MFS family permease
VSFAKGLNQLTERTPQSAGRESTSQTAGRELMPQAAGREGGMSQYAGGQATPRADGAGHILPASVGQDPSLKRNQWLLLTGLALVFFTLLALYCAVLSVLLPNQIELIDRAHKAGDLAVVFAITSIFSTLTTPIAGALSDRTRTRWGRRTPWIVLGSIGGAACLAAVSQIHELWSITVFWVGATVGLNCMQSALTTVVADRFPPQERGKVSGFVGGGMTAGGTVGIVLAGHLAWNITLAYLVFALAIAVVCVGFVVINPEPPLTAATPGRFDLGGFLKSFWVDPRQHPDFAWAFCGRFTIYMGYQGIVTYLLYILQDYISLSIDQSNRMIASLSTVTFFALVIAGFGSGLLSDAIGRRKPLVFAAGLLMTAAMTVPLLTASIDAMYAYAVLIGIGYGAFMSVDMALMTQVLPKTDGESTGKDLGILTTAVNIPQILSPVWAAWLLSMFHNDYRALFISAIAFVFCGTFLVLPIKSVR